MSRVCFAHFPLFSFFCWECRRCTVAALGMSLVCLYWKSGPGCCCFTLAYVQVVVGKYPLWLASWSGLPPVRMHFLLLHCNSSCSPSTSTQIKAWHFRIQEALPYFYQETFECYTICRFCNFGAEATDFATSFKQSQDTKLHNFSGNSNTGRIWYN